MGAVCERARSGSSSVETKPARPKQRAGHCRRPAARGHLPCDSLRLFAVYDGFGRVVEQVVYPLDFLGAPVALMELQGMAQIVNRLMNFRGPVLATQ